MESPISRPVTVSVLPSNGFGLSIEANEKERAALAAAHDLLDVPAFEAGLLLTRWRKDGVRVRGKIAAKVVQNCVVTLDPVETEMNVAVDAVFLPEGSKLKRPVDDEGALLIDPEGPDTPETFTGGIIDAGAVAEEFFELAIDPYPRISDAELPGTDTSGESESDGKEKPFAGLSILRDKL
jgi:hypothetical protein